MKERKTAIKSIRAYCVTVCCAGDQEWVRECPDGVVHGSVPPCPLWSYRMGKNPNISEESREKRRESAKRSGLGGKFTGTVDSVL
jgi:hypothetical protein